MSRLILREDAPTKYLKDVVRFSENIDMNRKTISVAVWAHSNNFSTKQYLQQWAPHRTKLYISVLILEAFERDSIVICKSVLFPHGARLTTELN